MLEVLVIATITITVLVVSGLCERQRAFRPMITHVWIATPYKQGIKIFEDSQRAHAFLFDDGYRFDGHKWTKDKGVAYRVERKRIEC